MIGDRPTLFATIVAFTAAALTAALSPLREPRSSEKADYYGRTVHKVSRWLASSKTCSACGHRLGELPLKIRQWTCPSCRAVHDRDHNAAKVILAAGRAERLNACGARVSPQPVAAVGVEAGCTPTAAA